MATWTPVQKGDSITWAEATFTWAAATMTWSQTAQTTWVNTQKS